MGTDLHAPLGQARPPKRKPSHRRLSATLIGVAVVFVVIGISVYFSGQDDGLKQASPAHPPSPPPETAAADSPARQPSSPERSNSGANIERTPTADGGYVTKYTPRDREGPLVIDAQRVGQDPRIAGQPNPDLLEETSAGKLPIIAPDGLRSMDQYARPWSGARGTRIAIVVGGLGLSQTGSQKAVQQLPAGVTLAFAASGNSLQRWMQEARRKGHEILLQVPLEPFDYPANDPGPGTLLTGSSAKENLSRLHDAMAQLTNYTGVMNYQGGRYLSDEKALRPVLQDLANRGLLFLDDGTSPLSKTGTVSDTTNLPHAFADVVLDAQLQTQAILRKLDDLERIADRQGTAIGVASAFDESIEAIRQWSEEATQRGIEIVGVSAVVRDKGQP
ncbi:divergent polysaccharide deacetylase family protein [Rhizobium sp. NFR07]|uniref:divergent polysaccharide deacetylase family protein n=1 Tax=Rhizobium sp. NFR07 TaxID=1566262 RepID=UPI000B83CC17|nr:divergent polysaccharide deacetylase family protein [Rhizobium sp. NFR07]